MAHVIINYWTLDPVDPPLLPMMADVFKFSIIHITVMVRFDSYSGPTFPDGTVPIEEHLGPIISQLSPLVTQLQQKRWRKGC